MSFLPFSRRLFRLAGIFFMTSLCLICCGVTSPGFALGTEPFGNAPLFETSPASALFGGPGLYPSIEHSLVGLGAENLEWSASLGMEKSVEVSSPASALRSSSAIRLKTLESYRTTLTGGYSYGFGTMKNYSRTEIGLLLPVRLWESTALFAEGRAGFENTAFDGLQVRDCLARSTGYRSGRVEEIG